MTCDTPGQRTGSTTLRCMRRPAVDAVLGRRTAWASLACTLVAGVVVLLEATLTDLPGPGWPWAWWTSLAVLVVVQLVATGLVPRPPGVAPGVWPAALVCTACGTFLLYPDHGLTAALLVVSAAAVARLSSRRWLVAVIAGQTAVGSGALALLGWPPVDVVAGILAFGGFQIFGALVVLAARGEAEARNELAATHAELGATVALLEDATRDAERLRISRDLHDVIGHQLTALSLELEVAAHRARDGTHPDVGLHVEKARSIARALLSDVRAAIGEMRATRRGLAPTLRSLAADVPGLTVSVRTIGDDSMSVAESRVVLRWAQESITNTLRHAGADRLDLLVEADADEIRLSAADNGQGSVNIRPGHGLTGMRERLESLGGDLRIQTAPGRGFEVAGRLPRSVSAEQRR